MSTPFNVQEFLIRLHNFATVDGQLMYVPESDSTEHAMRVAGHVVALTSHLTELTDSVSSFYADRTDTLARIMKLLSVMMAECAKGLAATVRAPALDAAVHKRVAVCLVLCHACLRYAQRKLDVGAVYTFPGKLQVAGKNDARACGGALATALDGIVPVIPSDADARWLVRALSSLLDVMGPASIYEGCVTFAKLPEGTWLPEALEGHDYTRRVIQACLLNAGRGTADMELIQGYDWDKHVVVDGVRARRALLLRLCPRTDARRARAGRAARERRVQGPLQPRAEPPRVPRVPGAPGGAACGVEFCLQRARWRAFECSAWLYGCRGGAASGRRVDRNEGEVGAAWPPAAEV
jgi:hypothetical protein